MSTFNDPKNKNNKLQVFYHYRQEDDGGSIDIELINDPDKGIDSFNRQNNPLIGDIEVQKSIVNSNHIKIDIRSREEKGIEQRQSKESKACWILLNICGLCLMVCNQMIISQRCALDSDYKCEQRYFQKRIYLWVAQAICNSAIAATWFVKVFHFNKHSLLYACMYVLSYIILHTFDNSINTRVYSALVNKLQQLLFIFFITSGLSVIIYKKSKESIRKVFTLILTTALIIASIVAFILLHSNEQCNAWNEGINPSQISNNRNIRQHDDKHIFNRYKPIDSQYCQIITPQQCWYYSLDPLQDMQQIFPQYSCQNQYYSENNLEYFTRELLNKRFLGFPSTPQELHDNNNYHNVNSYQINQLDKSKGYESIQDARSAGHEVILDKQKFKYHIQVQKNITLSEQQKRITEQKLTPSISDNILLINVNGLTRIQMHAKLPKTLQWFKSQSSTQNNQNKAETNASQKDNHNYGSVSNQTISLEFVRYHSFAHKGHMEKQSLNLFYGQAHFKQHQQKIESIFDSFKKEGFITGYSNTFCKQTSLQSERKSEEFLIPITKDHDSSGTFACDPNFEDPFNSFSWLKGSQSSFPHCLYGEQISRYALEYASSFFESYEENKKFFMIEFSEAREKTGQVVKLLDDELIDFLEKHSRKLMNTTIILMSSQQKSEPKNIYSLLKLDAEKISSRLPIMLFRLPNTIDLTYQKILADNSQRLVTIRNVHFTLKHIASGTSFNQQNESLFVSQQDYAQCPELGIPKQECSCNYRNIH